MLHSVARGPIRPATAATCQVAIAAIDDRGPACSREHDPAPKICTVPRALSTEGATLPNSCKLCLQEVRRPGVRSEGEVAVSADDLLAVPTSTPDRPEFEVAEQPTDSAAASAQPVAIHSCDRLLRAANPPSRAPLLRDWWQRATRGFRRV